jgi:hypothetical protein
MATLAAGHVVCTEGRCTDVCRCTDATLELTAILAAYPLLMTGDLTWREIFDRMDEEDGRRAAALFEFLNDRAPYA